MRYSDSELVALIKELKVVTLDQLGKFIKYNHAYLCKRLRNLIDEGSVKSFQLKIGSSSGRRGSTLGIAIKLFDGLANILSKRRIYYYIESVDAVEFIGNKLNLSHNLPRYHRKQLTHYLKRNLPNELFLELYLKYSK